MTNEEAQTTIDKIIHSALKKGVSDLHFEPQRDELRVRCRIDGVLYLHGVFPRDAGRAIADGWKAMMHADVAERYITQNGFVTVRHEGREYRLRVQVLSSLHGEKILARVVQPMSVGLANYPLAPSHIDALKRLTTLPSGLIIASGSVGTGKTVLLYSLLQEMRKQSRTIATVEDPIEHVFGEGVTQTAVDRPAGLTYPVALRALLQSDSDVIYCGYTRDQATAELAVEAARTGKLVLTALSKTDMPGVVWYLRDLLRIAPRDIADTLAGILCPRLVRRIDTRETEEYQPAPEDLARLEMTPGDGPFRRGVATEANHGTGFSGRIALLEVVEVGEELQQAIAAGAAASELRRIAATSGTLFEDTRAKVRDGLTTVEEANRVL